MPAKDYIGLSAQPVEQDMVCFLCSGCTTNCVSINLLVYKNYWVIKQLAITDLLFSQWIAIFVLFAQFYFFVVSSGVGII